MIKAVLFDMDGVLIDSEEYMCRAAILMFAEKGVTVTESDFTQSYTEVHRVLQSLSPPLPDGGQTGNWLFKTNAQYPG